MKITTTAPANIAFIKYWGRQDESIFLPANNSISMNLSGCITTTTIELDKSLLDDFIEVKFNNQEYQKLDLSTIKAQDLLKQVNRIRDLAGSTQKIHVKSENNFPADAGIASSASSFAAITAALLLVFGLDDKFFDKQEFSRQIRLSGSGSAARSALGGFVELLAGFDHQSSYAVQIASEKDWELVDLIAIVDPEKKKVSSSEGHSLANTSPYFQTRIKEMQSRIIDTRKAIVTKDFSLLGECIEADMISMHLVMMTQKPALFYWAPGSLSIMKAIRDLRETQHIQAYCTLDAGANVHVICQKQDAQTVKTYLQNNPYVKWMIYNEPCEGVQQIQQHLF